YTAYASNGGCPARDSVYVKVVQYPMSILDHTLELEPICFEDLDSALTLTANFDERLNYLWNTGELTSSIEVPEEGTYSVSISRNAGEDKVCEISDQITLRAFCPFTFYVPNAFTPDGQGGNEVFYAYGTQILTFELTVYDRWGLKIFTSNDINKGWNGTYKTHAVQEDVYVWKAKFSVQTYEGSTMEHSKIGTVTVLR
ncbi:MAG: gliding motility-associated-like protein, partial [Saprospiraceae bacterium]